MIFMVTQLQRVSTFLAETEHHSVKIIHGSLSMTCHVSRYSHHQFYSLTIQKRLGFNSKKISMLYQTAQTASLSQLLSKVIAKALFLTSGLILQTM
jgi:hypothetical protein